MGKGVHGTLSVVFSSSTAFPESSASIKSNRARVEMNRVAEDTMQLHISRTSTTSRVGVLKKRENRHTFRIPCSTGRKY